MSKVQLIKNLEQQLDRLVTQLADLEECREDIDDDKYNETKEETLAQLREFEESLVKATAGDMTLDDNVTSMKLATRAAISEAFQTPEVMRLFAKKEPTQLRTKLSQVDRDVLLGRLSTESALPHKTQILSALKKLGETLTPEESLFLEGIQTKLEAVDTNAVGDKVLGMVQQKT